MKTRCRLLFMLLTVLLCSAVDRAAGELVTDIVRTSSRFAGPVQAGPLQAGSPCHIDSDCTYQDVPDALTDPLVVCWGLVRHSLPPSVGT